MDMSGPDWASQLEARCRADASLRTKFMRKACERRKIEGARHMRLFAVMTEALVKWHNANRLDEVYADQGGYD